MSLSPLVRRALLMLLVVALALPGSNWPLRAATHAADVEPAAMTMGDMPCDEDMPMAPKADHDDPCEKGCCPQSSCDFSACLATGVLPSVASVPTAFPPSSLAFAWYSAEPPSWPIDTPLRPPIA